MLCYLNDKRGWKLGKTSLEFTVFLGMCGNLPVLLQRTDSRKDAKIAKKIMDENDEDWVYPNRQLSPRVLAPWREGIWFRVKCYESHEPLR